MSHRWFKPTLISMIVVTIPMQVALAYGPQWRPSGINLQQQMPQQLPEARFMQVRISRNYFKRLVHHMVLLILQTYRSSHFYKLLKESKL